ncbi:hypothetical protein AWE51_21760 [Aquimarina aggregata]|uniref:FecR protein domain-containing protein n=2 Tax=Aquimarina aggregata TaxID=1642818 RepID=A0A163BF86_9FLAO|nr:hypothetical protein AWE51_21760 [Aquimarina aggregata]
MLTFMLNENENTYLAKWLSNDLSPEELEEFRNMPEYDDYKKIITGLEYFKAPSFDLKESLETTVDKLDQPRKPKVIKLKPFIYAISAAASIVLIIGLFFNTVTYTAASGQQLAIVLPDGSNIELNAATTLSHKRFFWMQNREVQLDGEAFFRVTSGSTFTVTTNLGTIEVLGTQFNVKKREKEFRVGCYEGKVRVSTIQNKQKILQKGQGVVLQDKQLLDERIIDSQPLWKIGESIFNSAPLKEVLDELERQYSITFIRENIDQTKFFTGGFNNKDVNIALESVLIPMGIDYTINGSKILLSTQ